MREYIEKLRVRFSEQFGRTGQEYLLAGLDMFHRYREAESEHAQAAVGNMIVGIEFLIKSYLAHLNLANIFSEMPQEVRMFLSNPEKVPRFFKWRNVAFDIHSESVKTLNFEESVGSFYVFFPHMKQLLMPHMEFLSLLRRPSLHSIVPTLNTFRIGRVGYAILSTVESINNEDSFPYVWYSLTGNDTGFLKGFEESRKKRVRLAITNAKKAVKNIEDTYHTAVAQDWETFETVCPVCRASGLLKGYTELAAADDEDGQYPSLDFFAVSFHCEECFLTLYDYEELKLAGMDSLYDRTKDIDKWFRDHSEMTEWDINDAVQ